MELNKKINMALIFCFATGLIFYYFYSRINEVNLTRCITINYPDFKWDKNLKFTPLWHEKPSEYKINQIINLDSSYSYMLKYLDSFDYKSNDYIISNHREIKSIFWSPSKGDEYYHLFDKEVPIFINFDTLIQNSIFVYKLEKGKYRISQDMNFEANKEINDREK